MIAGYIVPDAGTIHVNGRLLSSPGSVVPPDQRGMGMVFQNYAVWPHKTVYENVVFGLKVRKTPAAEREEEGRGRARAGQPRPASSSAIRTSSPAASSSAWRSPAASWSSRKSCCSTSRCPISTPSCASSMRIELKQLQRRTGITFVYVTHDQAEALALSDQIAVIHGGRLQQYGTPQEVYARPANRVVADFMGLVNLVPAKVDRRRARIEAAGGLKLAGSAARRHQDRRQRRGLDPAGEHPSQRRPATARRATISERTFLGNISEYYASLDSGPTLRVQTHPGQVFAVGDKVAVEIDATQCSVFRSSAPNPSASTGAAS